MNNSLISVIIPAYNVGSFFNNCIDSIVNQTYSDLEIIIVDDGSTDDTPKNCDDWAKKDSRIKVVHKENGGASSARNAGLDIADGDYIAFVDADDYLDNDMYEIMLRELEQNNADAVRCAIVRESSNGYKEYWGEKNAQVKIIDNHQLLCDVGEAVGILPVSPCNKLFKRECIGDIRFHTAFKYAEDTLFNFQVAQNINKMVYHDVARYHYVNNTESLSHQEFDENRFDEHRVMDVIFTLADDTVLPYCIKGDVLKSFRTIKEMIDSGNHTDRFNEIRQRIISHKSEIFKNGLYLKAAKLKISILYLFPNIYKFIIKKYAVRASKKYNKAVTE